MVSFIRRVLSRLCRESHYSAGRVVVGLGNIGDQYNRTRHNIGFDVVDVMVTMLPVVERYSIDSSDVVLCRMADGTLLACVKPLTYVNRSGAAVQDVLSRYNLDSASCLIIADDFHIPLGTMRLRKNGSDGGHNGLKSVIAAIGENFVRLRIGVGPLPAGMNVIDFVLGSFTDDEKTMVSQMVRAAAEAVLFSFEKGIEPAMNRYNSVKKDR